MCNHEVVPNYLRTRLDPKVQERLDPLLTKAETVTNEAATKQVTAYTKMTNNLGQVFQHAVDEFDQKSNQRMQPPNKWSPADTASLQTMKHLGRGLAALRNLPNYQIRPPNM